jgi:hypothetical protein
MAVSQHGFVAVTKVLKQPIFGFPQKGALVI